MSSNTRLAPYAALTLRVTLGAMYLAHSVILKLLTFGLPGTADFFSKVGLPGWLAYVTFAAEAAGVRSSCSGSGPAGWRSHSCCRS